MTTGAHSAKSIDRPARHDFIHRQQTGARGAQRRAQAVRIHRRVGIELHIAFAGSVLENQIYIRSLVHTLQVFRLGQRRLQALEFLQQT